MGLWEAAGQGRSSADTDWEHRQWASAEVELTRDFLVSVKA